MPPQPRGVPTALPVLPCRKPTEGRDYWVPDDVLPDADAVRQRCLAESDWVRGRAARRISTAARCPPPP
ncbi:hypothetical protein ACFCYB_01390 [Streptomyces sp. NPDC056309]|uniref:hypothetical protein n=1 Tax=unclassified Streptomyces TaxID=2593676 RepID=UPI0035E32DAD